MSHAVRPSAADSAASRPVQRLSLARPLLMGAILFLIALVFKWIDTFVIRGDERLGELIISKSLGFALVLVWIWLAGRKPRDIGLHTTGLGPGLLVGALSTLGAFVVGYGVEFALAAAQGAQPTLRVGAIDSKMGVTGGVLFALWLLLGNVINSFMEEGLFRGAMGRLARIRFSFWRANWFQALIFAIWHLPWVLKYYQLGQIETGGQMIMTIISNSVPQLLIGLVYGYLFLKTGNLWAPWIAHMLSNSVLNLLHTTTTQGMDVMIPLRMSVYTVVMFLALFWVRRVAAKQRLSEAKPWT
ncbi:MAG: CPBP family intramembrane metalloprotease [Anaerolineae bacterium]|nr:CPBP family intramembrane metalloprotease [Anaerolineae bacterium]